MIMKLRYCKELQLFCLVLVLTMTSCIDENFSNCVQCSVSVSARDSTGRPLPTSLSGNLKAYLFINGKFDRIVTAEPDGNYLLSYDSRLGSVSLVTIGTSAQDSVVMHTPSEGDDIGLMSASVKLDSVTGKYILPSFLYYGVYNYTSGRQGNNTTQASIVMLNKPVTLRVVVRQLKETFGDGSYSVVISGFRSIMTFTGQITGDSIDYSPRSSFDGNNQLVTDAVRSFPNKTGEHVTVSVYKTSDAGKSDTRASNPTTGTLIWSTDRDENGDYVSLNSGDNKVIILDCGRKEISMSVVPWTVYTQSVVIP